MQEKLQTFIAEENIQAPRAADIQYMMVKLCGVLRVSVGKKLKRVEHTAEYQASLNIEDIEARLRSSTIYIGF